MSNEINNYQDIIDSRDIIARIKELQDEKNILIDELQEAAEALQCSLLTDDDGIDSAELAQERAFRALEEWEETYQLELNSLIELQEQGEGYASDWLYGEILIRDSYFEEYAQNLAEDIGAIDRELSWPNRCIDWEQAAEELQQDYTTIDFDGVPYWIR